MLEHNENKNKIIFITIIISITIKMIILNVLTPLYADDYVIIYVLQTFNDYINVMISTIVKLDFTRFFVIQINYIFFLLPNFIFSFIRALFYVLLILLIYKIANTNKKFHIQLLLFITFSLWLFTRNFGEVMFWRSGFGYLIAMVVLLLYLLPFHLYITNNRTFKRDSIAIFGMFLFGFFAGMSMEVTSGATILVVIMMLVYCLIFKVKIKKWMLAGLTGNMIGFIANFNLSHLSQRISSYTGISNWVSGEYDHIRRIFSGVAHITRGYITGSQRSLMPLMIIFVVLIVTQIFTSADRKRTYISIMYAITSIICAYIIAISPVIVLGRPMFTSTVFMIIACVYCAVGIEIRDVKMKIFTFSTLSVLAIMFITSFIDGADSIISTKIIWNNRNRYILEQKAQGNLHLMVDELPWGKSEIDTRYSMYDMSDDPNKWINMVIAQYYGLESIIAIPRSDGR
ncbi:MAG: DUF6056 family protein [Oscillospiraceae bacterium]|jgi:hypothetical protein|nr:DUF6056 family protein [Oscillospiraceae bacterium]